MRNLIHTEIAWKTKLLKLMKEYHQAIMSVPAVETKLVFIRTPSEVKPQHP